jgi:hypothetical protein
MKLKLAPILALSLPALILGAANANIRGSQQSSTSIRELSSDSTDEETTLSGGTWLFYLMLNAVLWPVDASGHGCNSASYSNTTSTTWTDDGHTDDSVSWGDDGNGYNHRLLENTWGNDSWGSDSYAYSSNSWGGDSHQSSSSTSKPKPKPKPKPPKRCVVPHAPKPKPPKKPSPKKPSSSHHSWGDDTYHSWGSDAWGNDAWGNDAWGNDAHSAYTSSQLAYNDGSGGSSGVIVGVMVSLIVAAVAAALVAKKVSLSACLNF